MSSPFSPSGPPPASIAAPTRRDTVLVAGRARERARLARRAAEQGHLVLQAASVPEALTQGQGARPDLILVPGDSKGLRALAQLRESRDLGSVAAIVLTLIVQAVTFLTQIDLSQFGKPDLLAEGPEIEL